MEFIHRFIKSKPAAASELREPSRSYLLTRSHGLHDLGLCRQCHNIDLDKLADGASHVLLENCFDLIKTSERCRMCAYISDTLQNGQSRSLRKVLVAYDLDPGSKVPLRINLRESFLEVDLGERGRVAKIKISSDADFRASGLSGPKGTRTPEHDIISALRQEKPLCFPDKFCGISSTETRSSNQSEVETLLPLRVIDVGDDRRPQNLHLHVTEPNERGHYATLSYRWGCKLPLKTTRRTLKRHRRSLEPETLPQTFLDAINVTRSLGIRYLWIDALCIVQDDHQDWLDQAAKMGGIYHRSLVTIAVHSAKDSAEGFLWRRNVPSVLEIIPKSPKTAFWVNIPALSESVVYEGLRRGQIANRAWIIQELCLSRWVMHFVEDRIIWECSHRDHATVSNVLDFVVTFRNRATSTEGDWLSFVGEYSSCQITKATDKLPAIAGIAQAWHRDDAYFDSNGYYSGVFTNDVHRGLLWYRKGRDTVRRPEIAPSWSWASVDGEVGFVDWCSPTEALLPCMEVSSFECECGRLTKGHFTHTSCSIRLHAVITTGIEVGFREKSKRFSFVPFDGPRYVTSLLRNSQCVGWAIFDDKLSDCDDFHYVAVAFVSMDEPVVGFYVLIVKPSSRSGTQSVRVGMGCISNKNTSEPSSREMITIA